MSLLIVTSRYLKSGTAKTKSQRKNYTKYIATRESVEVREQSKKYSTENQKKLLNELLNDFPESKKYLEFEDYKNNPTAENASELISIIIERNADVIGNRQNFVGYMAMRPGVEKRGEHGLFNESNEPIVLDQIAEEVANHPGNVWSHIVSLRREDAIRLGYDNSDRWRELVMRHIADIAEQTIIPLCNLKWYGAFHDTTHHPHIHLIVYSTNPKQGFLTKQGIDKIRSVFANDIFHDELQSIYQEQTLRRDELKMESKKYVEQLVKQIAENHFHNANLENLILTLKNQLDNTKGKKVYGYLKPEVKKTADENEYAFYALGKLYLTEEKRDVQCAVSYFEKCSNMNTWASYWLGKIYLFGCEEVPQNREKALQFLTFSAERGNGYAQNILDNMEQYQSEMLTNTIFSLFVNLSRCLSEDYNQKFQSGRISVDKKLRRMMQEKKQALGMKEERTQTQEQSY